MNSILPNTRKHDISFHASGKIEISAYAAKKLSLAPGDVIDIATEGDEYFLYVKFRVGQYCGRHSGRVFATNNAGKGTFRTWSKSLSKAILSAAGKNGPLRCPSGDIITRNDVDYLTVIIRCSL